MLWRLFCAFISLISVVYLGGWLTNRYTPSSIDSGVQTVFAEALRTDISLLALFSLQHSGMARRCARPLYLLATALVLGVMFRYWEPMPGMVWYSDSLLFAAARWAGVALIVWSVAALGSRAFLGLTDDRGWKTGGPYRWMRHPMLIGTFVFLWAHGDMTQGRLLFNCWMTVYGVLATRYLEARLPMQ